MNENDVKKTIVERMEVIERGLAYHVDGCPLQRRVWNGIPYANVIDDCWVCLFREFHT